MSETLLLELKILMAESHLKLVDTVTSSIFQISIALYWHIILMLQVNKNITRSGRLTILNSYTCIILK
jgi:hypothetical protein